MILLYSIDIPFIFHLNSIYIVWVYPNKCNRTCLYVHNYTSNYTRTECIICVQGKLNVY